MTTQQKSINRLTHMIVSYLARRSTELAPLEPDAARELARAKEYVIGLAEKPRCGALTDMKEQCKHPVQFGQRFCVRHMKRARTSLYDFERQRDQRKQSIVLGIDIFAELRAESKRQGRTMSSLMQYAWKIARKTIRQYPSDPRWAATRSRREARRLFEEQRGESCRS